MRRFFIPPGQIHGDCAVMTGSDVRHASRVLRLTPGAVVCLFDGSSMEYDARIESCAADRMDLTILARRTPQVESPVRIAVAQALLKGRKMDELIRRVTELGVAFWFPVLTERSVPSPGVEELARRRERWDKIAREAAKQCGRIRSPAVGPCLSWDGFVDAAQAFVLKIVFSMGQAPLVDEFLSRQGPLPESILVAIGPEGGFAAQEVECLMDRGFKKVGMGPRTLRAETAAVAACTLVQHVFGDMGGVSRQRAAGQEDP